MRFSGPLPSCRTEWPAPPRAKKTRPTRALIPIDLEGRGAAPIAAGVKGPAAPCLVHMLESRVPVARPLPHPLHARRNRGCRRRRMWDVPLIVLPDLPDLHTSMLDLGRFVAPALAVHAEGVATRRLVIAVPK